VACLVAAGCSGTTTTTTSGPLPKEIADDLKARGIPTEATPVAPEPSASEFKPYTSPEGTFRINFPGEPSVKAYEASKEMNRESMKTFIVEKPPRGYAVAWTQLIEKRDPAKEIADLIETMVRRGLEAKLRESKDLSFNSHPGKEIVIIDDDRARRARLYVVGKNVYQVSVDLPATEVDGPSAKTFVESFEIIKE
jgi:hypothetical protein